MAQMIGQQSAHRNDWRSEQHKKNSLFTCFARGVFGAFLKRCRPSGIEDLHFHDLRHEATSRLFEKGFNPVEVATITGHKDPRMLMRYTQLRPEDLARKLGWMLVLRVHRLEAIQ